MSAVNEPVDRRQCQRCARALASGADRAAVRPAAAVVVAFDPLAASRAPASAPGHVCRVGVGSVPAVLPDRPDPHHQLQEPSNATVPTTGLGPTPLHRCRADGRACAGPAARRRPSPATPSLAPRGRHHRVAVTCTLILPRGRTPGTLDPKSVPSLPTGATSADRDLRPTATVRQPRGLGGRHVVKSTAGGRLTWGWEAPLERAALAPSVVKMVPTAQTRCVRPRPPRSGRCGPG